MRTTAVAIGPGSRALRRGRVSLGSHVYHVTAATWNRAPRFLDFDLARCVARALNEPALLKASSTLAWVVMPDHFHWLLQLGDEAALSALVRSAKSSSALQINRARGGSGTVWQKGYYDHLIRNDENLVDVARYIVANPVRAGLVKRLGDYPHWDATWLQ